MNTLNAELLSDLFLHCKKKETGTLFITSSENRSCQVVLKAGEILSMCFGTMMGNEVANSIHKMRVERFSFKKGLVLPMPDQAIVTLSSKILQAFGYQKSENSQDSTSPVEIKKQVKMYRGNVIQDTLSEKVEPITEPKAKNKKPLRIYRGQVIHS